MSEKIHLQQSYSALNEKLAKLFDESGVRRSFTVPYIDGQPTADHIDAVGQAALQSGGLTNNLLTTAHHSEGKGWGSGDGHTVAHPADKLRSTIIPHDDEKAKAVIAAAQTHLDNIGKLIGDDDPSLVQANSQLKLVKRADGAGMNLMDFGVMMTQLMYAPNQAISRAHSGTKEGGHAPQLRAPGEPAQTASDSQAEPPEAAPGGEDASEASPAAAAALAASAAPVQG